MKSKGALTNKRWCIYCDECRECGKADFNHYGKGYCARCYKRLHNKKLLGPSLPERWSIWTDACLECGRTDRPHESRGICHTCRQSHYRSSSNGQEAIRQYIASDKGQAVRRACTLRYQQGNRGRKVTRRCARRTRETQYGIHVELPLEYEDLVYETFGKQCVVCGAKENLTLDHHLPMSQGYSLLDNAVVLCLQCNARKNNRTPHTFYDAWKLTEITVFLWEVRVAFDSRFDRTALQC